MVWGVRGNVQRTLYSQGKGKRDPVSKGILHIEGGKSEGGTEQRERSEIGSFHWEKKKKKDITHQRKQNRKAKSRGNVLNSRGRKGPDRGKKKLPDGSGGEKPPGQKGFNRELTARVATQARGLRKAIQKVWNVFRR